MSVPSAPLLVPAITPMLAAGVGLAAALFDAVNPKGDAEGSAVIVLFSSAAITAGLCVFRFTVPARTLALLYVNRSRIGESGLAAVKKSSVFGLGDGVGVATADARNA